MSKPRDLASLAFENLVDVLENEDLSDLEAVAFFHEIANLAEQESAEIADELDSDDGEDDEDEDE